MDMILDAAHDDGLAIEVAEDAAQVAVQFLAQEWSAVLGRKDDVQDDLGQ